MFTWNDNWKEHQAKEILPILAASLLPDVLFSCHFQLICKYRSLRCDFPEVKARANSRKIPKFWMTPQYRPVIHVPIEPGAPEWNLISKILSKAEFFNKCEIVSFIEGRVANWTRNGSRGFRTWMSSTRWKMTSHWSATCWYQRHKQLPMSAWMKFQLMVMHRTS